MDKIYLAICAFENRSDYGENGLEIIPDEIKYKLVYASSVAEASIRVHSWFLDQGSWIPDWIKIEEPII